MYVIPCSWTASVFKPLSFSLIHVHNYHQQQWLTHKEELRQLKLSTSKERICYRHQMICFQIYLTKSCILKSPNSAKNCDSGPDCSRAFELSLSLKAPKSFWVYSLKISFPGQEPKHSAPCRPDPLIQGSCMWRNFSLRLLNKAAVLICCHSPESRHSYGAIA